MYIMEGGVEEFMPRAISAVYSTQRPDLHSSGTEDHQQKRQEQLDPHLPVSGESKNIPVESLEFSRFELEESSLSPQSDEEELEAPLPLRSEEDWLHSNPAHGHCHTSCGSAPTWYHAPPWHPATSHLAHTWHPCTHSNWLRNPQQPSHSVDAYTGLVSVNVPHFSLPPTGGVSQAQIGGMASGCFVEERRRGAGLPEECRNIFITYSSDASSDVLPFAEFLTKHGFRPTIDVVDVPVNCTDINSWRDRFLKDPSTLIIIAISPKYKADVEGIAVDSQGLHTKYIHSMMQNEFIQQGSLNFRFIPVTFLNASQEHVPCWLQNTIVYHWPRHSEDLLLRLLRRERYAPPPVTKEISVIIQPVPLCATTPALRPL
ncbi:E3 ubiquitin ligase TRAF3IP2-like [Boleophthalmus pectinirostris]|uniref:E3 ubiquitin ligase TRAF3IP2-like n=1 Tax=Boleophthalmus pectinirostris TaxID=150288 RepID=UPI00242E37EB|nr:E3 ubiquitin ligase TRAF3IP2-like [Boleophthalmus pectinirostris]